MPEPESSRRRPSVGAAILGTLAIVVGGLIALFAGGCSIYFISVAVRNRGFGIVGAIRWTIVGVIFAAAGVAMVRQGIDAWQGD